MAIPVDDTLFKDLLRYLDNQRAKRDKTARHLYQHLLASRIEHERWQQQSDQLNTMEFKKDN
jgi:hypothetical protein